MDLKNFLLDFHKTRNINYCVRFFHEKTFKVGDLLEFISLNKEYPFPEYGSWLLSHIAQADSSMVLPFRNQLIDLVLVEKNQSVLRNIVKIIESLGHSSYKETELLDRYISFIKEEDNKVALQAYSMYCLVPFIHKYPELKEELTALIQLKINEKSPAYKVAFKTFLNRTKKST